MKHKAINILLFFLFCILSSTVVYAQNTTKLSNVERANQIVKTLLPDKDISIYADGIMADDVLLRFDEEIYGSPIITAAKEKIDEEEILYLHLCCMAFDEYENWETLEGHTIVYKTWSYRLTPDQLPLAQELTTLIDTIRETKE